MIDCCDQIVCSETHGDRWDVYETADRSDAVPTEPHAAPSTSGASETVEGSDIDVIDGAREQLSAQRSPKDFAAGENLRVDDLQLSSNTPHTHDPSSSIEPVASPKTAQQYYRHSLGNLRECADRAAACTEDARKHRNEFLVGVATLVLKPRFAISSFCNANCLPCTKATEANPFLAVIQAGLPKSDRKLASKWGIGLKQALLECGGTDKLSEYLKAKTIEECVTAARAAKRRAARGAPDPAPACSPAPSLVISNVPPPPDGRVTVTIEITGGRARFISQANAAALTDMSANPVARCDAADGDVPFTETVLGGICEIPSTHSRLVAREICHDGPAVAGDKSIAEEVQAGA